MKGFKFRAWHKELKTMNNVCELHFDTKGVHVELFNDVEAIDFSEEVIARYHYDDIELMQWTGLQDKEGKDIYEGDILVYDHGGGVDSYIIERQSCDNQLHARYLYMSDVDYLGETPLESSVIVGNRWKNPELLEAEDD